MWNNVNFKWSTAGLNSKFSFSLTGFLTKAKKSSLNYNLIIAGERERDGFMPFQTVLEQVKHKQSHPRFELGLRSPFLMTITATGVSTCRIAYMFCDYNSFSFRSGRKIFNALFCTMYISTANFH